MASNSGKVDRHITTPFFLRLFYKSGSFHRLEEFQPLTDLPPHLQIYTWPSCTLRELSHIITSAIPEALPEPAIGTRVAFRLIYPEPIPRTASSNTTSGPGRFIQRDLGSVIIGDGGPGILPDDEEAEIIGGGAFAGPLAGEPDKSLQDARFMIGDYICCAILPPLENGAVPPPPTGPARSGFGGGRGEYGGRSGMGPRENGYGGGYRGRGGSRGGGGFGGFVPSGEWRRGERLPEGPAGGRGRGYGGGYGGRGRY